MNIPEIKSYEDQAINTVVSVINKAHEKMGVRQNLFQIAQSREIFASHAKLSLASLGPPLAVTGEKFIDDAIKGKWRLKDTFKYILKYMGGSQDECSQYYYFELIKNKEIESRLQLEKIFAPNVLLAIFSQPTVSYPIPQVTVSVFFRIEDKHIEPPEVKGVPSMHFRIEGSNTDYDVRYVLLTADWLLAVMKMKLKFFNRLEDLKIF